VSKRRRRNINNRTVEALSVDKDTVFWDRRLAGFGVRAYPSGAKVYIAQARGPDGAKRVTLGRHGVLRAGEARRLAARSVGRIVAGQDPAPQRLGTRHSGPTVAEAAEKYLTGYAAVHCKPRTVQLRESVIRVHILPALGSRPLSSLTREDALDLHQRLASTPTQANTVIVTLSQIFLKSQLWGLVPPGTDPCAQVQLYRQRKRERFLTEAEISRLGRVLEEELQHGRTLPSAIAAIRLLMLTGCRKNEILTLRWKEVDFKARQLRLRDAKTGPRAVPLSGAAVRLLEGLRRSAAGEWVIEGGKPGTHLKKLGNAWRRLRIRADLQDVRLHDLRHSFASSALALGESLPMIGKLLGHRRIESTARYAHLARGAVREAAERVAGSLAEDVL